MLSFKRLTRLIYGNTEPRSLNRKIYVTITLSLLLASFIGNVLNLTIHLNNKVIIATFVVFIVSIVFYFLARNSKYYKKTIPIALGTAIFFVIIFWLTNGGYNGPTPYILLLVFLGFYMVVEPSQRGFIFLIAIALYMGLIFFQNFNPHLVEPYISTKQKYYDTLFSTLIFFSFIFAIIEIVLTSYLSDNKMLNQKNKELHLITQKIKQSEYRFKSITDQSPDVIFLTDLKGQITYISSACFAVFGYAENEMIGNPFTLFLKESEIERAFGEFSKTLQGITKDANLVLSIKRKDNSFGTVELKASKYLENDKTTGTIGIIRDITERTKIQEKINVFSKIVEQSPASIIMASKNGTIEYSNSRFNINENINADEIIGKNINEIKAIKKESDFYDVMLKTMKNNNIWKGEIYNKKDNGSYLWEMATIFPIKNDLGTTTHYVALKQDITERKILTEQLLEAMEQAEESDRLKSAFLANMSHEIRTPLNGIIGFSALLKKPSLTQTNKEKYIKIINKNAEGLLHIISDILDISKIESGQMEICQNRFDVNKMISELFIQYKEKSNHDVKLIKRLCKEKAIIDNDEFRLRQVFINLLDNALKFTQRGSIEFGIDALDEHNIYFFVRDTGFGIAPKDCSFVFDQFRQAEHNNNSRSGNGLGLSIVKQIIELMGGQITLRSELNKGTEFNFWLPIVCIVKQS